MSLLLASMDAPIKEDLLVTMFVKSFENRSNSLFGSAFSALLKRDDHIWELAPSRLLQELESQKIKAVGGDEPRQFNCSLAE